MSARSGLFSLAPPPKLWLLVIATAVTELAQAANGWTPDDIKVSQSAAGEPPSLSARFEVAPNGDARIAIEQRDGTRRTGGTVLLIGGRWMLTQGSMSSSGKEVESLDLAVLDSQLVLVLLTAALPDGPPAPGPPQHVRFAEKNNPIRIATPTRSVEYRAPWTVVGSVAVPASDAAASYQLAFTYSEQGNSRTIDFTGSAGTAKAPLDIPDSMRLAGWKLRRLPQAQPDAAAQPGVPKVATIGELRRLR